MDRKQFKYTGAFGVIHHGHDGEYDVPLFLVDPILSGGTPHTFTTNICRAQTYAYYTAAKKDAVAENERLKAEGHPLAGRIEVGEIFVRDYEPKEEK